MENYDKRPWQETEALIKSGELDPNTLSVDELSGFLNYLCEKNKYDDECFYKCTDALRDKENVSYKNTAKGLLNAAIDEYDALCDNAEEKHEKHFEMISKKRVAALLVAAALVMSLIVMTAYAHFEPFSEFGVTIRELFGFKVGDSVENGSKELTVGGDLTSYASFDQLCEEFGISFYKINLPFTPKNISSSKSEMYTEIMIKYRLDKTDGHYVTCDIYGDYDTPPYDKTEYSSLDTAVCETYNGHEFVIIGDDGFYQAMLFEQEFIYIITASTEEDLELALNAFEN